MAIDIVLFKGEKAELGYEDVIEAQLTTPKDSRYSNNLVIAEARDIEDARKAAENRNIDIIYGIEGSYRKDKMHFRNSGMNQVICKLCRDNNTAIAVPIADIITANIRNELLGRIMQNIKFCRKYKVRMVAASFARKDSERRSPSDIESFLRAIGMTAKEAKESLTNAKAILVEKRHFIRKGVRIKE